jgi:hypothetical protein
MDLSIKSKSISHLKFLILSKLDRTFTYIIYIYFLWIARGTLRHNLKTKHLCLVSPPDQRQ